MGLTSHLSCLSDAFSSYRVYFLWWWFWRRWFWVRIIWYMLFLISLWRFRWSCQFNIFCWSFQWNMFRWSCQLNIIRWLSQWDIKSWLNQRIDSNRRIDSTIRIDSTPRTIFLLKNIYCFKLILKIVVPVHFCLANGANLFLGITYAVNQFLQFCFGVNLFLGTELCRIADCWLDCHARSFIRHVKFVQKISSAFEYVKGV